ncbi:NUDIX domain-containing protein [Guptibacillus algicola]|uniref:NUDIX domain-containing protein n=1 Tax=Guptibacillus algicola TaxID=225844 RepID=UPI001CD46BA7|nr:NUDIX domain-containing protein [Alkalihalobacillus algicola]MCA0988434.1 NUDIX domain-containing protein [Alkalihalobacillus algicola]
MSIRNSVKAIMMEDNKVLLTKNKDDEGYFYLFPGGGQHNGETFPEALLRECMEETGHTIMVGDLLFIREYIGKNHEHASFDSEVHQVEFYFACERVGNGNQPTDPDSHQVGLEWVELEQLNEMRVYPKALIQEIIGLRENEQRPVYLGDVN